MCVREVVDNGEVSCTPENFDGYMFESKIGFTIKSTPESFNSKVIQVTFVTPKMKKITFLTNKSKYVCKKTYFMKNKGFHIKILLNIPIFQFLHFIDILIVFHIKKMKYFFSLQKKIYTGHT